MRTLSEIIEIIKGYKDFKEDAEVARLLNIKPKTFAAAKSRNSIPHSALITFCNQENISINWLLAGVGPRLLEEIDTSGKKPEMTMAPSFPLEVQKLLTILEKGDPETVGFVKGILESEYRKVVKEFRETKKGA